MAIALSTPGCQTLRAGGSAGGEPIRRVVCIYSDTPWLNLDKAGDRDPEGVWYYAYVSTGTEPGVLRDGTFHVEMYRIDHHPDGTATRKLSSDWHYPTSEIHTIQKAGMLGQGYLLQLMWADKDTAGHEIELVTTFEDPQGRRARAETKRLKVPKYGP